MVPVETFAYRGYNAKICRGANGSYVGYAFRRKRSVWTCHVSGEGAMMRVRSMLQESIDWQPDAEPV